jgi:hypothetical protein
MMMTLIGDLERMHAEAAANSGARPPLGDFGHACITNAPRLLAMLRAAERMREALDYYACSVPPDFPCARPKIGQGGKCIDSLSGDCGLPAAQAAAAYDAAKGE